MPSSRRMSDAVPWTSGVGFGPRSFHPVTSTLWLVAGSACAASGSAIATSATARTKPIFLIVASLSRPVVLRFQRLTDSRGSRRTRGSSGEVGLSERPATAGSVRAGLPCVEVALLEVDAAVAAGDAGLVGGGRERRPGECEVARRNETRLDP